MKAAVAEQIVTPRHNTRRAGGELLPGIDCLLNILTHQHQFRSSHLMLSFLRWWMLGFNFACKTHDASQHIPHAALPPGVLTPVRSLSPAPETRTGTNTPDVRTADATPKISSAADSPAPQAQLDNALAAPFSPLVLPDN